MRVPRDFHELLAVCRPDARRSTYLLALVNGWRYGGDVDIFTEGLPASQLVAGVSVVVLEFLSEAVLTTLAVFLPVCLPTSLQAESLEFGDQGSGRIVIEAWILREETA